MRKNFNEWNNFDNMLVSKEVGKKNFDELQSIRQIHPQSIKLLHYS